MPTLSGLFQSVLVPALVCGALLAVLWSSHPRLGEKSPSGVEKSPARAHLQALAFAAGMLAGYHAIVGLPVLPSENRRLAALDWMPWLVTLALLVSLVQATSAGRRVPSVFWIALLCVLVPLMSFLGREQHFDVFLAATLLFVAWRATDKLSRALPGPALPIALLVVATGTSLASLFAHTAKIAQLSGALAACLGACTVVAFWNPRLVMAGGGVAVVMTVLGVCWINAVHFADLAPLAAGLLVLAVFLPSIVRIAPIQTWTTAKRILVCALLALLPSAAAVFVAHASAPDYGY